MGFPQYFPPSFISVFFSPNNCASWWCDASQCSNSAAYVECCFVHIGWGLFMLAVVCFIPNRLISMRSWNAQVCEKHGPKPSQMNLRANLLYNFPAVVLELSLAWRASLKLYDFSASFVYRARWTVIQDAGTELGCVRRGKKRQVWMMGTVEFSEQPWLE